MLDHQGRRFVNELGTRDYVTGKIFESSKHAPPTPPPTPLTESDPAPIQPEVFIVLHSKMAVDADKHVTMYSRKGLLKKLETIEALADFIGTDVSVLLEEFGKYNLAAETNATDEFGKKYYKNVPWTRDSGPFYAGKVTPVLHYSMGGVVIDAKGRVGRKGEDGVVDYVTGLYAVGEVAGGIHGKARLGGNALTECVVFGRIVGDGVSVEDSTAPSYPTGDSLESAKEEKWRTVKISKEELAKHKSPDDVWVALYGRVYNFSEFLEEHPGGADSVLEMAGTDGTATYANVHTEIMLEDFEPVGVLE